MTPTTFTIGDLEVKGFSDGDLKTSLDLVVGMEREKSEELVGGTDNGSLFIPVNIFLFERGDQVMLIDAGAGNTMQPTLGRLPQNLRDGGYPPEAITHILLTHIHPDHANGLVDDNGEAIYPNAEILVHAKEYDFWMADGVGTESEMMTKTRARNRINLAPYQERVRRMTDGEELLGCSPILAGGHTPGHTCWRVDAGREAFLAWGDLVHMAAIQLEHPEIAMTYDLDREMARRSRQRILDMAAADRLMVAGAHVNAPGFGAVKAKGLGFSFETA